MILLILLQRTKLVKFAPDMMENTEERLFVSLPLLPEQGCAPAVSCRYCRCFHCISPNWKGCLGTVYEWILGSSVIYSKEEHVLPCPIRSFPGTDTLIEKKNSTGIEMRNLGFFYFKSKQSEGKKERKSDRICHFLTCIP